MGPEKRYEKKLRNLIESKGGYCIKQFGCAFTKAGLPDLVCCIKGKFLAIEVKADNGKVSPLQLHEIDLIQKAGGIAFVAYPQDFDTINEFLDALIAE